MTLENAPTIMVIEDDIDLRDIYVQLLEHEGFTALGFSDGPSALESIKSEETKPKLILLDFMLPEMNGAQFIEALAAIPKIEKIPIIIVSALAGETPEISTAKSHPWVISFFTKTDVTNNKLVHFIKAYFGIED